MDKGREFHNRIIQGLFDELRISYRFTTPGHPQSHGMIERFYNTITEHLHLVDDVSRGIRGSEAVARAVLAYNNSVHSATGATPLELTMDLDLQEKSAEDTVHREKTTRTERYNVRKSENLARRIQCGDRVFIKKHYKRRKTDLRLLGPYTLTAIISRSRITIDYGLFDSIYLLVLLYKNRF